MIEVKIPSPGESVTEVEVASWLVSDGDYVEKDQEIAEIESDKATLPLIAEASGIIHLLTGKGESHQVGETVCKIDETAEKKEGKEDEVPRNKKGKGQTEPKDKNTYDESHPSGQKEAGDEKNTFPEKTATPTGQKPSISAVENTHQQEEPSGKIKATPVAQKMMEAFNLSVNDILKGLRRISKQDVELAREALRTEKSADQNISEVNQVSRDTERKRMTRLRKKLSERLVAVKNETAMLTTFNEADLSKVIALRKKYQQQFQEKHGIKLGFTSFFTKAITKALEVYPNVNAMIEGDEILYPKYADIGIAVQTPRGLMVPVIRNAEHLSLPEIEQKVKEFAEKGKNNRISIEEMEGGTFSITNGGVFGSLLSTPILNPPQSAILGMHAIKERPVAIEGKVEIRPMMYLALSYDHRLIDGKESVSFLVKIKELIENPQTILIEGKNPERLLLGI
ncbi:MAG: 2-oxoglutarate dehydrogenase complex dihydrolipoyllysine-residue succinyltransferase [Bacteroidota bacterium]